MGVSIIEVTDVFQGGLDCQFRTEAVAKQMLDDMNNNSAIETNNEPTES